MLRPLLKEWTWQMLVNINGKACAATVAYTVAFSRRNIILAGI